MAHHSEATLSQRFLSQIGAHLASTTETLLIVKAVDAAKSADGLAFLSYGRKGRVSGNPVAQRALRD